MAHRLEPSRGGRRRFGTTMFAASLLAALTLPFGTSASAANVNVAAGSSLTSAGATSPSIAVQIALEPTDCDAPVTIDYTITWQRMKLDRDVYPTADVVETAGRAGLGTIDISISGRTHSMKGGTLSGQFVRESKYFDWVTYARVASDSYEVLVYFVNADGGAGQLAAASNALPMQVCDPLTPNHGVPGTIVRLHGGGTFGGALFSSDTRVWVGPNEAEVVSVAGDGRSLQFSAPQGDPDSDADVLVATPVGDTVQGLPFTPRFHYDAAPAVVVAPAPATLSDEQPVGTPSSSVSTDASVAASSPDASVAP